MERLREIVRRSSGAQLAQSPPPHPPSARDLHQGKSAAPGYTPPSLASPGYTPPSLGVTAAAGELDAGGGMSGAREDEGAPPSVAAAMSGLLRLLRSDAPTF